MTSSLTRKDFIKLSLACSAYWGGTIFFGGSGEKGEVKIGIIGLDTSHSIKFTEIINNPHASGDFTNFEVVAAYPKGSLDIKSSVERIPQYTREVQRMGVEIVDSVEDLLGRVDVVLLETNDGRRHLAQALEVFKAGKPVFIDKPLAASLKDVNAIFKASQKYDTPVFSSSSLRYMQQAQEIRHNKEKKVLGAETYSTAIIEETHPDLYWYGIHGVEILFTVMGTGCKEVTRINTDNTDIVIGTWDDRRIGTFRGTRYGQYHQGGTVFTDEGEVNLENYEGYKPLLKQILAFFRTGKSPVPAKETMQIYAFMSAAELSKKRGGMPVLLEEVLSNAREDKDF